MHLGPGTALVARARAARRVYVAGAGAVLASDAVVTTWWPASRSCWSASSRAGDGCSPWPSRRCSPPRTSPEVGRWTYRSASASRTFGFDYQRGALDAAGMGALVQVYRLSASLMSVPPAIAAQQRRRLLEQVTR